MLRDQCRMTQPRATRPQSAPGFQAHRCTVMLPAEPTEAEVQGLELCSVIFLDCTAVQGTYRAIQGSTTAQGLCRAVHPVAQM